MVKHSKRKERQLPLSSRKRKSEKEDTCEEIAHSKLAQNDAKRLLTHAIVEEDQDLPEHLQFKVVLPNPNGKNEKLGPPQYEYPEGLYLIMAPARYRDDCQVKKGREMTRKDYMSLLPSYLKKHVVDDWPSFRCEWSLSGPQFDAKLERPTVQQRYCYPKGREEYESTKGGSLYTMYDDNHNEIYAFRILHVYYSNKRAKNKAAIDQAGSNDEPPKKKLKQVLPPSVKKEATQFPKHGDATEEPEPEPPIPRKKKPSRDIIWRRRIPVAPRPTALQKPRQKTHRDSIDERLFVPEAKVEVANLPNLQYGRSQAGPFNISAFLDENYYEHNDGDWSVLPSLGGPPPSFRAFQEWDHIEDFNVKALTSLGSKRDQVLGTYWNTLHQHPRIMGWNRGTAGLERRLRDEWARNETNRETRRAVVVAARNAEARRLKRSITRPPAVAVPLPFQNDCASPVAASAARLSPVAACAAAASAVSPSRLDWTVAPSAHTRAMHVLTDSSPRSSPADFWKQDHGKETPPRHPYGPGEAATEETDQEIDTEESVCSDNGPDQSGGWTDDGSQVEPPFWGRFDSA